MKGNKTILLVDDEPHIVQILEFELKKAGYEIMKAYNGREALALIDEKIPDLIIADVMMPQMDGYQLCQTLKNHPKTRAIPFIFLTAKTSFQSKVQGYILGAEKYITKPCNRQELLKAVNLRLKEAEQAQALFSQKSETFSGDLSKVSIFSLLDFFYVGKWEGTLTLTKGQEFGKIWFKNATIVDAEYGFKKGQEALSILLTWQEGEFIIERKTEP